jgi:hypothetical protein
MVQAKTTGRCQILRHGPPKASWTGDPSPARQFGQKRVSGAMIGGSFMGNRPALAFFVGPVWSG